MEDNKTQLLLLVREGKVRVRIPGALQAYSICKLQIRGNRPTLVAMI